MNEETTGCWPPGARLLMKVIIKDKHTGYHEGAGAEDSVGISRDVGHTVADFISQRLTGAKTWREGGGKLARPQLEQYIFTGLFLAAAHSSKAGTLAGRIGLSAKDVCVLICKKAVCQWNKCTINRAPQGWL